LVRAWGTLISKVWDRYSRDERIFGLAKECRERLREGEVEVLRRRLPREGRKEVDEVIVGSWEATSEILLATTWALLQPRDEELLE